MPATALRQVLAVPLRPQAADPARAHTPDPRGDTVNRDLSLPPVIGDCVRWTGAKTRGGYGNQYDPATKKMWRAHRLAYVRAFGPVPDGLEVDHLCGVVDCINVDHLEAVTRAENMRRRGSRIVECPQGHPYNEANTMWASTAGNGRRGCRMCHNARNRLPGSPARIDHAA